MWCGHCLQWCCIVGNVGIVFILKGRKKRWMKKVIFQSVQQCNTSAIQTSGLLCKTCHQHYPQCIGATETSLGAVYQITCSFLWSHERACTTFLHNTEILLKTCKHTLMCNIGGSTDMRVWKYCSITSKNTFYVEKLPPVSLPLLYIIWMDHYFWCFNV